MVLLLVSLEHIYSPAPNGRMSELSLMVIVKYLSKLKVYWLTQILPNHIPYLHLDQDNQCSTIY